MRYLRDVPVYANGAFHRTDISVEGAVIRGMGRGVPSGQDVPLDGYLLIPGFVDVHVHLREPGFSYKETIAAGTAAAARGGVTAVVTMPNVSPAPDCHEGLRAQLELIRQDARVRAIPCGRITRGGDLSDMEAIAPYVAGFSDDGFGVGDDRLMERAMRLAKRLGKLIIAHCEDESCPKDSPESEWRQLERDLLLAEKTGCRYHACHLSTARSVALMRAFKARGVDATCETAPHYLVFCEEDVRDSGRFRMNPPIRTRADREALIEGLADGTIDMIATDHAPHAAAEKSLGYAGSVNGVVGLETAFAALFTHLVLPGRVPLSRLLAAMCDAPRARFGIPGGLTLGAPPPGKLPSGKPPPGKPSPGEPSPGNPPPGNPPPGKPPPGEPVSGESLPGESVSSEPSPGESLPGESVSGEPSPGEAWAGGPSPGEPVSGKPPSGEPVSGVAEDLAVIDLGAKWIVDPAEFLSMGRSTPFEGMRLRGEAVLTVVAGRVAWRKEGFDW